jgi:hypothetical protein
MTTPSIHLRDALAAVLRSDQAQRKDALLARAEEARELRSAVRALIQHIEEQDRTIAGLVAKSYEVDPMRPLA